MYQEKKRRRKRLTQVLISSFIAVAIIGLLFFVSYGRDMPVLDTKGLIANQQRDLIYITLALGMFIVIPVFIMLFTIAWRYRAGNTKAKYQPNFSGHKGLEALWWGVPFVIIIILGIITAISTHALDPYKPIESSAEPVKIQVISMNWRWLFIYPDEGIATINYINIPKDTPVNFTITSDAPMNSFWIPALAGQVYSMTGMSTKLHVMADDPGTFNGFSSNISGEGFADMRFKVNAMNEDTYKEWTVKTAADTTNASLTKDTYKAISATSHDSSQKTFLLMDSNLYNKVVMKYMSHEMPAMKKSDDYEMSGHQQEMSM